MLAASPLGPARAQSIEDLKQLSLEQLGSIEITSVSKHPESLSDAAAAVYVISHDDIIRSGATTLPEMLRLAPNLEVAQLNATSYAISARGFNVGNNASMSDKLLVLIDGRTVYTPLFAGVYWDMQGVLPENVERIEIISGSGGTLYGANAVNGVINVITRNSAATQGGVLVMGGGNLQQGGSIQYGGRLTDELTYRVYGDGWHYNSFKNADGSDAHDAWSKPQGGFRLDWNTHDDVVTVQGDAFHAQEDPASSITGRDLVANWQHNFADGSSLQVQGYYDVAKRFVNGGGGGFTVDTYDLRAQHRFKLGDWNDVVWGAGERVISYEIANTPSLLFQPAGRTLNLADVFLQDTMTLTPTVKLTLGMKLESEPYTGLEPLPQVRLSWKPIDNALLWGAVSRAVRAPTPVDRDIVERIGTTDILSHSFNFVPETLTAYEAGTRIQLTSRASLSISPFYNVYDDLRSIEPTPGGPLFPGVGTLPLRFANLMAGHVYGVEMWGDYRVTDWWRLSAGFNIQHESLRFQPGSSGIGGIAFAADDPSHQASLRSSLDLGNDVTWDASLRYIGKLHNPAVPDYAEFNTRLGWKATPYLELSLSGFNLIHSRHAEFVEPGITDQVPRSFFLETRWRF